MLLEHLVCLMKSQNLPTDRQMFESPVTMAAERLFRSQRSYHKDIVSLLMWNFSRLRHVCDRILNQ